MSKPDIIRSEYEQKIDASLGLIYRVNGLFSAIERSFIAGQLDRVNLLLDRIYCNLLYRIPMDAKIDETTGKVVAIRVVNREKRIHSFFNKKIRLIRKQIAESKNPIEKKKYEARYYRVLELKDIWLRKFMQSLGWYMNEKRKNPGRAMFGGE